MDFDEVFALAPSGQRALLTESSAGVSLSIGTTERLDVDMLEGDDEFNTLAGVLTLTTLVIKGGDGADLIFGGIGDDVLLGGDGDDSIFGRGGNDIVTGGNGNDILSGDAGDDVLVGNAGNDQLTGDEGDDRLSGNAGADSLSGGAGNDVLIWNSGDGNDTTVSGGSGVDIFEFHGSGAAEQVTVDDAGSLVLFTSNVGPLGLSLATFENIDIATLGGNDVVTVGGPLPALLRSVTVDTGAGNDSVHAVVGDVPLIVNGGTAELDTLHVRAFCPAGRRAAHEHLGGERRERVLLGNRSARCLRHPGRAAERHDRDADHGARHDVAGLVHHARRRGHGRRAAPGRDLGEQSRRQRDRVGHKRLDHQGRPTAAGRQRHHGVRGRRERQPQLGRDHGHGEHAHLLARGRRDRQLLRPRRADREPDRRRRRRQRSRSCARTAPPIVAEPDAGADLAHDDARGPDPRPREPGRRVRRRHVDDGVPLVVERTMFWDASYYGSHGGTAVDGPRTRWLFAEGSRASSTRSCCSRTASASATDVTLTFLREGSTPFVEAR